MTLLSNQSNGRTAHRTSLSQRQQIGTERFGEAQRSAAIK